GIFNCTIDYYSIPPSYVYSPEHECFIVKHNPNIHIALNSVVKCRITSINYTNDICSMQATLRHIDAGVMLSTVNTVYTLTQEQCDEESSPLQLHDYHNMVKPAIAPMDAGANGPPMHAATDMM